MATLTINGHAVSADPEQTILEAARAAGILDIPTLCWYPTLPVVGNCRICLVSVEGQAKLLPACATKVSDGMVVQTESHAAVENRRGALRGRSHAPRGARSRFAARRRAARRSHDPARHEHVHPVHALRAGVRGHP